MDIVVDKNRQVADLLCQFSEVYPYLKLVIFWKGEELRDAYTHLPLDRFATIKNREIFNISPTYKVSEVEDAFKEYLGIKVKVYRKLGENTWLETSFTSNWSLEWQNAKGVELFQAIK
jgi:hypothetical protein